MFVLVRILITDHDAVSWLIVANTRLVILAYVWKCMSMLSVCNASTDE